MANRSSSPNSNLSRTPKSGVKTTPKKLPRANPYPADLRSVEHNENEADPRMNRSRSPAPKNFMSPTISAASKRKVHRWESPKIISNPEEERESSPPAVSADEEEVVERESESVLPPYDPKINYLSPRPRFLHYRPKPRLELFVNGDGDLEEEPEEPPVSRSSSKIKSMGMLAFMFVLILGLTGFLLNPSWISSSSEDLMDLQKLPGNMKNWSLELAVSLREEDLGFFYALSSLMEIAGEEREVDERETESAVTSEEDNGVHLSLPSPHTLLGVFSALLAVVAIAIAPKTK